MRFYFACFALLALSACQSVNPIAQVSEANPLATGQVLSNGQSWFASREPVVADNGVDYRLIPINPATIAKLQLFRSQYRTPSRGFYQNFHYPPRTEAAVYRLGQGDELEITLINPLAGVTPETATQAAQTKVLSSIDHEGNISAPLAGTVQVGGQTLSQARTSIKKALESYLKQPDLHVRVARFTSQQVVVGGMVRQPRTLTLKDRSLDLTGALQLAGGVDPGADPKATVVLVRGSQRYRMPLFQVLNGDLPEPVVVKDEDQILVISGKGGQPDIPQAFYIGGEVLAPQRQTLNPEPSIPTMLSDALFQAQGWIRDSADPRHIYVIRLGMPGRDCKPADQGYAQGVPRQCSLIYQLDLSHAGNMVLANQVAIHPGDFIFVATKPVAHWNSTFSQIWPTIGAGKQLASGLL